jgi:archaellum biogenesis ATPase FlaH
VIVSSRNGHSSYISQLEKLPYYLSRYFLNNSFIIIYPKQTPSGLPENEKENADNSILDTLAEKVQVVNKAGNYISNIFRRKK